MIVQVLKECLKSELQKMIGLKMMLASETISAYILFSRFTNYHKYTLTLFE